MCAAMLLGPDRRCGGAAGRGAARCGAALLLTPVRAGAGGAKPARAPAATAGGGTEETACGFPLSAFLSESVRYCALVKPDCFLFSW